MIKEDEALVNESMFSADEARNLEKEHENDEDLFLYNGRWVRRMPA